MSYPKAIIFDMFETLISHYTCPTYFGKEMAQDAGIPEEAFQVLWHGLENERTLGKISFEEVIEKILRSNNVYSREKYLQIINKRKETKIECFNSMHPEIIPLLKALKEKNIKIALISNCFSEEAQIIKQSLLFPYFDSICLSCDLHLAKPDHKIFYHCLDELNCKPEECIYIGDGGSKELETARELKMKALQAVWYFDKAPSWLYKPDNNFIQLKNPLDLLKFIHN